MKEPEEVLHSTNQYKSENDTFSEFHLNKIIHTQNINDKITRDELYTGFKFWYKNIHEYKPAPSKIEFEKNINKLLGIPINGIYYNKIKFSDNIEIIS